MPITPSEAGLPATAPEPASHAPRSGPAARPAVLTGAELADTGLATPALPASAPIDMADDAPGRESNGDPTRSEDPAPASRLVADHAADIPDATPAEPEAPRHSEPETAPESVSVAEVAASAGDSGPRLRSQSGPAEGTTSDGSSPEPEPSAAAIDASAPYSTDARRAEPAADALARQKAARRAFDLDPTSPCMLFAGELSWPAGPDILLDALDIVCGEDTGLQIIFAGSGPMQGELEVRVRASGWARRCRILGDVAAPRFERVLDACDFVAVPARVRQRSGLVRLALSRGKPVLTTHQAELPMIVHGRNGLVTYDNPGSFVWGIREMTGPLCRDLRRHLMEAA